MKKLLLIIIAILAFHFARAQADTLFWFVAPRITTAHFPTPIEFKMASFNDKPVTVTLSKPADPTFIPVVRTIPANGDLAITYTTVADKDRFENKPPNQILNFGVLIEATDFISVYYEISTGQNNPEIFSLKGVNALGTDFMIPGQTQYSNATYNPRPWNSVDIVATEDGTSVTITPTVALDGGRPAGTPFTIALDKGETFCCASTAIAPEFHLHGTVVTSDKPIAITVTDDSVGLNAGFDLTGDQIVPTNIIGKEYIAIKGGLSQYAGQVHEKIYILAIEDNTNVYLRGSNIFPTPLDRGQTYVASFTGYEDALHIRTDKPVYAYQLTGQGEEFGSALLIISLNLKYTVSHHIVLC